MAHPLVVHCKQYPGFDQLVKEGKAIYVGRPSKWGNPYHIGYVYTRDIAILIYQEMVRKDPKIMDDIKAELKGKILGCWCAPKPCHGDVLARIANEEVG